MCLMLQLTPLSVAGEPEPRPDVATGMRLCGYFANVAQLVDVGRGAAPRRTRDPRIDAVGMHLAAVHSMPLHRIVELVAHALARRARNGKGTAGRGRRRTRARTRRSAVTFTLGQ